MSFVGYKNGNYRVLIDLETGTKIRENDLDFFRADFPESFDVKITNQCDIGCAFCHENSTCDGKHGNILSAGFIDKLHPYTEMAIGGGNPLAHPDLVAFLYKCKKLKLIPSMTVNQRHFMENVDYLKTLCDSKLIYGLGISLTAATPEFIAAVKQFPTAVIHVINGIVTASALETLANNNLKVLILGYKEFRRGKVLYGYRGAYIESKKQWLYENLPTIVKDGWFSVVSFDNLAIKQLEPKRLLSKEEYDEFYMGDDGSATMYVDLVNEEFAKSSTSIERYPLMDNIVDMFNKIRID